MSLSTYLNGMKLNAILLSTIIAAFLLFPGHTNAQSWPTPPTFSYGCMSLDKITFNTIIDHTVVNCGLRTYPNLTTKVDAGKTYTLTASGGCYLGIYCSYGQYISIWADWNIDGDFNDPGEKVIDSYSNTSYSTHNISITIPSTASSGKTMMRVANRWTSYGYPTVTGDNTGYGDYNDIQLDISNGTANPGIISINKPVSPFLPGIRKAAVTVQNFGEANVTSYTLNWSVDGVSQGSKLVAANLAKNQSHEVELGDVNIQYKPDYSAYTIRAWITDVNGKPEDCSQNAAWCLDNDLSRGVAPSLAPGQYTVGGVSPFFADLAAAITAINAANILGNGQVELLVRPGIYNGNLNMNALGTTGNSWWIHSVSGNPNDVVLNATTSANLLNMNNMSNVTFEGISFNNLNGGLFNLSQVNNLNIINCNFTGMTNAPALGSSILLNLSNVNNLVVDGCNFNNGSVAIQETMNNAAMCPRNIRVMGSSFNGFSQRGAQLNNAICSSSNINFSDNYFIGRSGVYPAYGFNATNDDVTLIGNQFTGYQSGTAVVQVSNTGAVPGLKREVHIENNNIAQAVNMAGIQLTGLVSHTIIGNDISLTNTAGSSSGIIIQAPTGIATSAWIENNVFAVTNGWVPLWVQNISNATVHYNKFHNEGGNFGLYFASSTGNVANNTISGNNSQAIQTSASNLGLFYNTFATTGNAQPTAYFVSSTIQMRRNIFQNWGTSAPLWSSASNITDSENIYYTMGTVALQWNANNIGVGANGPATILNMKNGSTMQLTNSHFFQVAFYSKLDLRLNGYYPQMIWSTPLFASNDWRSLAFEQYDFEGSNRNNFYYAGADNITPEIIILRDPEPIADCVGTLNHNIYAVASATAGVELLYQWYKDGAQIPYTQGILYFDELVPNNDGLTYEMTGVYHCEVFGAGAPRVASKPVLVNVLRPVAITRQPVSPIVAIGDNAVFEVEVQVHGDIDLDDPLLQPDYQWWKNTTPPTKMVDDIAMGGRIAGANSSILSIRDIQSSDLMYGYYVEIMGHCGNVMSEVASLYEAPDFSISSQPMDSEICEGESTSFMVGITQTGAPANAMYQWMWNGQPLEDNAYFSGTKTNTLVLTNVITDFAGNFDCQIWLEGKGAKMSESAMLTVEEMPKVTGQSMQANPKLGEPFELFVEIDNAVSYQWFKDDEPIDGAITDKYNVESTTEADAGTYYCMGYNSCGGVSSLKAKVEIQAEGSISDVNDLAKIGVELKQNVPNPFSNLTTIEFSTSAPSMAVITITDAMGNKVATIFSKEVSGTQRVEFDANDLNLASGIYYYTLSINGVQASKQMHLVK